MKVNSVGATRALIERAPLITDPYTATDGVYLIAISHPIFGADGSYRGFISASLFLRERNALHGLLGVHYYRDGSYLYVVDTQGNGVPRRRRAGRAECIEQSCRTAGAARPEGSQRVINTRGVDMLAGYAPSRAPAGASSPSVPRPPLPPSSPSWHAQRCSTRCRSPSFPSPCSGGCPNSSPHQSARWPIPPSTGVRQRPRSAISTVNSWYFEVARLKVAMLTGVSLLQQKMGALEAASMTDPLTGLRNRRGRAGPQAVRTARSGLCGAGAGHRSFQAGQRPARP